MAGPRGFRFALAALLVGAPAAAQDPLEGVYIVERMETASMLELAPEGRFRWALSYGALDLRSEGRWRRDVDSVVLDTEPPVSPPRFELIETVRDGTADLSVRVELE